MSTDPVGLVTHIEDRTAYQSGIPRLDADYEYDRLGQLIRASTSDYVVNYEYDQIQNLVRRDLFPSQLGGSVGAFQYAQNGAGPNQITNDGKNNFVYNDNGRSSRLMVLIWFIMLRTKLMKLFMLKKVQSKLL